MVQIKVMEYNILNGFHTETWNAPAGTLPQYKPERQAAAVDVVRRENPDILVLCEANFSWPTKYAQVVHHYGKIFGYEHCFVGQHGDRSGTAILSRFPMQCADYSFHHRPFVRALIQLNGKTLTIDMTHPHPELIDIEKEKLFRSITRDRKVPYIFVGDFNTLSPQDKYNRETLVTGFARFDPNAAQNIEKMYNSHAIQTLIDQGLIDTFIATKKPWTFTVPTDLLSTLKDTGTRLDYIFCSPDFKIIDAGIINDELTNKASDHHPILAVLEI